MHGDRYCSSSLEKILAAFPKLQKGNALVVTGTEQPDIIQDCLAAQGPGHLMIDLQSVF